MVGTNNRYPVRMLTEAPRRNAGSFFSVLTFVGGGPSSGNQVGLMLFICQRPVFMYDSYCLITEIIDKIGELYIRGQSPSFHR